jgi:hypothetical protein
MKWLGLTGALAALVVLSPGTGGWVLAQTATPQPDQLRRQIERRFDVRPLTNGVLLLPKEDDHRIRMIEVTDTAISIDGTPATGAEVREKLGADADLVLQLSYLDAAARRQVVGSASRSFPEVERSEPQTESSETDRERAREERRRERDERRRERSEGEDRVRFGGSVSVAEGESVRGDVVAIGGAVRIDGEVTGNAVAIGGGLELGPNANLHGDAVSIGGALRRDPGAQIGGKVVDLRGLNFDLERFRWNGVGRFFPLSFPFLGAAAGAFALMATIMRVVVLCVLASLVLLVGRDYVERVSERAAAEPLKAGAVGVLAQLLFVPLLVLTIIVLVVTLIGIPLLALIPFAMLAFALVFLVGFTAVAYHVGRLANARFRWQGDNPYVTAAIGILLLVSPLLIARLLGLANWLLFPITGALVFLGLIVEYIAWTVGFGAVALLRFSRSSGTSAAA